MIFPPPLALTLGDPAGIGPEIVVKAWRALRESGPTFVVLGDPAAVRAAGADRLAVVDAAADAISIFRDAVPVFDPGASEGESRASAIIRWIEQAVGLTLSGETSAVVTAPIAKAPLYEAGFRFPQFPIRKPGSCRHHDRCLGRSALKKPFFGGRSWCPLARGQERVSGGIFPAR